MLQHSYRLSISYTVGLRASLLLLEWRNWQTHGTQNPAPFTGHVGSTPTSSTIIAIHFHRFHPLISDALREPVCPKVCPDCRYADSSSRRRGPNRGHLRCCSGQRLIVSCDQRFALRF